MYTNTSLGAIINGLGKTGFTFFINIVSTLIRLFFVFYMISRFGILGYLWGVLISQLFAFMVSILYINGRFHMFSFRKKI
jgi:stage V sporulation protein B